MAAAVVLSLSSEALEDKVVVKKIFLVIYLEVVAAEAKQLSSLVDCLYNINLLNFSKFKFL